MMGSNGSNIVSKSKNGIRAMIVYTHNENKQKFNKSREIKPDPITCLQLKINLKKDKKYYKKKCTKINLQKNREDEFELDLKSTESFLVFVEDTESYLYRCVINVVENLPLMFTTSRKRQDVNYQKARNLGNANIHEKKRK